ncbi:unnamed protein product [Schistosoma curassoni]|uniref:Uncharacterized protein n=1 Tax=Schistosoma curassoni TaxID=6186 RepID=A0A183L6W6_9TREM|nr:unnamed protein product [Schistosoma curassoni]
MSNLEHYMLLIYYWNGVQMDMLYLIKKIYIL